MARAAAGGFGVRVCPKCLKQVEEKWRFCPHDGTDLSADFKSTTPIGSSKVCPRCGKKYDSRVRFCQQDGAELVRPTRGTGGN